jgi:hypothetical protein
VPASAASMIVRSKIAHGRDLADHRVRSREYRRWAIVRVLSKKREGHANEDRSPRRQAARGQRAQLVEVLPYDAYDRQHLPGAIGIPLGDLDQSTVQQLRADQTVVMYCHDAP